MSIIESILGFLLIYGVWLVIRSFFEKASGKHYMTDAEHTEFLRKNGFFGKEEKYK